MRDRDLPAYCLCVAGGVAMKRSMVYDFATAANEASSWPYNSDALVPQDRKMLEKYRKAGRLVADSSGGVQVRVESPADYKRLCAEQGKRPLGDYDKINRSRNRPWKQAREKRERARNQEHRKEVRKELREKGVL